MSSHGAQHLLFRRRPTLQPLRRPVFRPLLPNRVVIGRTLLIKRVDAFPGLWACVVDREPFAPVTDRKMPAEISPEIELLLGIASFFWEFLDQFIYQFLHRLIEVCSRHDVINQPPIQRFAGGDLFIEQEDFPRAPVSNDQRQELRSAGKRRRCHGWCRPAGCIYRPPRPPGRSSC